MNEFQKSGNSIYNDEIRNFLYKNIQSYFENDQYSNMVLQDKFCNTFKSWIESSKLNNIMGLDSFNNKVISLGVTQSLDQFHYQILANKKRLRMFRGEYPYNRDVCGFNWKTDFIDDHPLEPNDAIIISCPFSGTGNIHEKMTTILDQANDLNIPVFIDMAWFGTCANINIDLSHPAIKYVAFSTTKGLTCGNYRAGIRFSKIEPKDKPPFDRLNLQYEWSHGIHLNTKISYELMRNFTPDHQFNKYRSAQIKVCEEYDLKPSSCVHIASGDGQWDTYKRDNTYNRVNIRKVIKKWM